MGQEPGGHGRTETQRCGLPRARAGSARNTGQRPDSTREGVSLGVSGVVAAYCPCPTSVPEGVATRGWVECRGRVKDSCAIATPHGGVWVCGYTMWVCGYTMWVCGYTMWVCGYTRLRFAASPTHVHVWGATRPRRRSVSRGVLTHTVTHTTTHPGGAQARRADPPDGRGPGGAGGTCRPARRVPQHRHGRRARHRWVGLPYNRL